MTSTLNIADIFRRDAEDLRAEREKAIQVHSTDIRAAGNQVEVAVRDYLRRMLPPRYYVTHGHLIDSESRVSPQIDVIIADNLGLPSLLTTNDGTEYVPVTSVYAIGEVKSTFDHSKKHYHKMRDDLRKIATLNRPLAEHTAYGGLKGSTTWADMTLPVTNRYLNNLYSFMFCVNGENFNFERLKPLLVSENPEHLPNAAVFLNKGVVVNGKIDHRGALTFNKYPNEVSPIEYDWCFFEVVAADGGSLEGSQLAFLYGSLIEHLSKSHLEPPNVYQYTANMSVARLSSLRWAKEGPQ